MTVGHHFHLFCTSTCCSLGPKKLITGQLDIFNTDDFAPEDNCLFQCLLLRVIAQNILTAHDSRERESAVDNGKSMLYRLKCKLPP